MSDPTATAATNMDEAETLTWRYDRTRGLHQPEPTTAACDVTDLTQGRGGGPWCRTHEQLASRCPTFAAPVVPYSREALVNVVIYHHRESIKGCRCGWSELGRSWAEHVADVYEATALGKVPLSS